MWRDRNDLVEMDVNWFWCYVLKTCSLILKSGIKMHLLACEHRNIDLTYVNQYYIIRITSCRFFQKNGTLVS